jgi:hypothetical protein
MLLLILSRNEICHFSMTADILGTRGASSYSP